jgi:hypothetical protein
MRKQTSINTLQKKFTFLSLFHLILEINRFFARLNSRQTFQRPSQFLS